MPHSAECWQAAVEACGMHEGEAALVQASLVQELAASAALWLPSCPTAVLAPLLAARADLGC